MTASRRLQDVLKGDLSPKETGDTHRKDAGKPGGFWLLPWRPVMLMADCYQRGAKKYAPNAWRSGMAWSRVIDPVFRHIFKWIGGETHDPIDGQHHLAAAAWGLFALMEYEETHPELDDIHPQQEVAA